MKKLPKLFTNSFNEKIDNSKEYTTVREKVIEENKLTKYEINKKIDMIFKSKNYIYKVNVLIKFNDKELNTTLIGKTKDNLITLDNKLIKISDIYDINLTN